VRSHVAAYSPPVEETAGDLEGHKALASSQSTAVAEAGAAVQRDGCDDHPPRTAQSGLEQTDSLAVGGDLEATGAPEDVPAPRYRQERLGSTGASARAVGPRRRGRLRCGGLGPGRHGCRARR